MTFRVDATPDKPVLFSSPGERTIGRFFKLDLPGEFSNGAATDLAGDVFFALYQAEPETVPKEDLEPSRQINKEILDWFIGQPALADIKVSTTNNVVASLSAAAVLWKQLKDDPSLQEVFEQQGIANDAERNAERLERTAKLGEQGKFKWTGEHAESNKNQTEAERRRSKQAADNALKLLEEKHGSMIGKGLVKTAARAAGEEAEKTNRLMKSWGIDPGTITAVDVPQIMSLANSDIQEIANIVGRLKGVAARAIERVKNAYTGTVTDVAMTKDIQHLFPMQRAYLSAGAPRYLRIKALSALINGGGLLGWRPKVEGKRSGAFLALVDKSGSMMGKPMAAAKGIALGMALALRDEKLVERRYSLHYFDAHTPENLARLPYVTSEHSWREHIEWARVSADGGTIFDYALAFAIQKLHELKKQGIDGADLLFITDEQSEVSKQTMRDWRALTKELGTRMITISIGGGYYESKDLEELSDVIVKVSSRANLPNVADALVDKLTASIIKNDLERSNR